MGMARPASVRRHTAERPGLHTPVWRRRLVTRWWNYPTAEFESFNPKAWSAIAAARERGGEPNCIRCNALVRLKLDCEPVCFECAYPATRGDDAGRQRDLELALQQPHHLPFPHCSSLITNPGEVLRARELTPSHICEFTLRASTNKWANECLLPIAGWPTPASRNSEYGPDWDFWQTRWPLPIGREAIREASKPYEPPDDPIMRQIGRSPLELLMALAPQPPQEAMPATLRPLYQVAVESAATILLPLVPFEGTEKAALALRVQVNRRELDLFGLGVWPDPLGPFYLGPSLVRWADGGAFRPEDKRLPFVVNFERMWRRAALQRKAGRPQGRGTFEDQADFLKRVGEKLRDHPNATLLETAQELCEARVVNPVSSMKSWMKTYKTGDWESTKSLALNALREHSD